MPNEDIIKGYQVDKDRCLEVTKDELENIALDSTRTIEIDEFVPRTEIDDLYLVLLHRSGRQGRPRYLRRDPGNYPITRSGRDVSHPDRSRARSSQRQSRA